MDVLDLLLHPDGKRECCGLIGQDPLSSRPRHWPPASGQKWFGEARDHSSWEAEIKSCGLVWGAVEHYLLIPFRDWCSSD